MTTHTKHQIIEHNGEPVAVIVPFEEYNKLVNSGLSKDFSLPHEIIKYKVEEGLSSIAAWRKFRQYTQLEMANLLNITQSAYSQLESRSFYKARKSTQLKLIKILDTTIEQMLDFEQL